jgi:hypothetical protein
MRNKTKDSNNIFEYFKNNTMWWLVVLQTQYFHRDRQTFYSSYPLSIPLSWDHF